MKKRRNFDSFTVKKKYIYILFLIVISLSSLAIRSTYAKFTSDYTTDDDVVGFSFDFGIGISDIEEYEEIKIEANDAKVFNVKIDNDRSDVIYYGVWYRISGDVSDDIVDNISVSKLNTSEANTSGSIKTNSSSIVSVIARNKSSQDIKIDIGVASSSKDINSIAYLDGRKLISGVDDIVYLSNVDVGSYVNYVGTNGCSGNSCSGYNVNYVSDDNMGYCYKDNNKYKMSGFRVGYIKDDTVYLISAGSLGCVATDSSGKASYSNIKLDSFEYTVQVPNHMNNLNMAALNYCNEELSYGGICNNYSAWNINSSDFKNITGSDLGDNNCYKSSNDKTCDFDNDLIDNGGYYWLGDSYLKGSNLFYWDPNARYVGSTNTSYPLGFRPVLRLDSSVYIVSGTGSYEDPYNISNELVLDKR